MSSPWPSEPPPARKTRPATHSGVVFLDRDGVINRDSPDYVKSWAEFEFLPGSLEAIRQLTVGGFALIVITNQSAVHRGLVTRKGLELIHRRMAAAIRRAGGELADIFYCPHTPDEHCRCRKPLPGLILEACRRHSIDPAQSVMVGDRPSDIACGREAGCGRTVLVTADAAPLSGGRYPSAMPHPDFVAANLLESVEWIMSGRVCAS